MLSQIARFPSFLWLSRIPLCVYVCEFITLLYPFIYWGALRLPPCFECLLNNAAMNICFLHVSFLISVFVFFGCIPRSGIDVSYGSSIFNFWGIFILFSTVAVAIYVPSSNAQGFPFLYNLSTTSPALVICGLFDDSHSGRCEVISHCRFHFHFSDD